MCSKCRLSCQDKNDVYFYYGYVCAADCDIKHDYTYGRPHDAIALLRGLPSEFKAVILDELQQREKEDKPRL